MEKSNIEKPTKGHIIYFGRRFGLYLKKCILEKEQS